MEIIMELILFVVLLIVFIIILIWQGRSKKYNDKSEIIKILIRQSSRYSVAALQDQNDLIALLHSNYGSAYVFALNDIATDSEIANATGIDPKKFRDAIVAVQDQTTRRVASQCPNFAPVNTYLSKIAAEN